MQRNDAAWVSTFPSGGKGILSQIFYEIATCKNVYHDHKKEAIYVYVTHGTYTEKYFISGLYLRYHVCTYLCYI